MSGRPPKSTLVPYTTLFGSVGRGAGDRRGQPGPAVPPLVEPPRGEVEDLQAGRRGRRRRHPYTSRQSDRKSTRLNSSHANISYAVFCLKKKNWKERITHVHL